MDVTINDQVPFIDLVDGSPKLSFYFTDAGPLEEEMWKFIDALENRPEENTLTISVRLKEIIDGAIDGLRLVNRPDRLAFSKECRPMFEAIKADLLAVIEKIDSADYVE